MSEVKLLDIIRCNSQVFLIQIHGFKNTIFTWLQNYQKLVCLHKYLFERQNSKIVEVNEKNNLGYILIRMIYIKRLFSFFKDPNHAAKNLLNSSTGKWLCAKNNPNQSAEIEIQFAKAVTISFIDIGKGLILVNVNCI